MEPFGDDHAAVGGRGGGHEMATLGEGVPRLEQETVGALLEGRTWQERENRA